MPPTLPHPHTIHSTPFTALRFIHFQNAKRHHFRFEDLNLSEVVCSFCKSDYFHSFSVGFFPIQKRVSLVSSIITVFLTTVLNYTVENKNHEVSDRVKLKIAICDYLCRSQYYISLTQRTTTYCYIIRRLCQQQSFLPVW